MSTSAAVAYSSPNRSYGFSSNPCFGNFNRLDAQTAQGMQIMEWHPQSRGRPLSDYGTPGTDPYRTITPRMAMEFINSFGMWKDKFWLTSIGTVAADLANMPADQLITGFMSIRDYQIHDAWTFIDDVCRIDHKIEFALRSLGVYRRRFADQGGFLSISGPNTGESGICSLLEDDDAIALYLLAFGTAEEFEGCWAQSAIGQGPETQRGYVRGSSSPDRTDVIRRRRPHWNMMASWLRSWLAPFAPAHLAGKMGRLNCRQVIDRINQRSAPDMTNEQQAEIINTVFEELREFYS